MYGRIYIAHASRCVRTAQQRFVGEHFGGDEITRLAASGQGLADLRGGVSRAEKRSRDPAAGTLTKVCRAEARRGQPSLSSALRMIHGRRG